MRPVAHSVNDRVSEAYYSDTPPRHPAHLVACPTCGAARSRPCVNTIGAIVGSPIRGLHAARLRASEAVA